MALDQAMLDDAAASGSASLRLYRWDPPCLSLGRNEDPSRFDDLSFDIVRRPTGGSAVWHEHEVTYAVAAPVEAFGSLRAAYRTIHERIAIALRALGVDATLAPDDRRSPPPPYPTVASTHRRPCFASSVPGEIQASGRKLVGSAQVRQRRAFLQHGSILLDGTQEMVARVGFGAWDGYETTLRAVLGRVVTFDEVAEAIVQNWGGAVPAPVQS